MTDYVSEVIQTVANQCDITTGNGKTKVVEMVYPLIMTQDINERERYFQELAKIIGVTDGDLKASLPFRRKPLAEPVLDFEEDEVVDECKL